MNRTARIARSLLVVLLLGVRGASAQPPESRSVPQAERDEYLELYAKLAEAVAQIELNSAAEVDREQLFEAALRGMLSQLDPYSTYLDREQFAKLKELAKQPLPALGLELALEQGRLVVLGVRPGSPAADALILPGETVLEIAGTRASEMTLSDAERFLRSSSGAVTVQLAPKEGPPRSVTLRPATTIARTVAGTRLLAGGIGYVRVSRFSRDTPAQLREAIDNLPLEQASALVLDLRYNPGGLLDAATDTADLFLNAGRIVSVVPPNQEPRVWNAEQGDLLAGKPIAVLVNRFSASGSEVVAAALQDNRRATIVGERTWGKGSVQSIIPLADGHTALKLTTARYVRPSGENIHRFRAMSDDDAWGVTPDEGMRASLSTEQDRALLEAWRRSEELPEPDAQLQKAISLLTEGAAP